MKKIIEQGFVFYKEKVSAKDAYVYDGKTIPAREEHYKVHALTGGSISNETGIEGATRTSYKVDLDTYNKAKLHTPCECVIDYYGDNKAYGKEIKLLVK